MKNSKSSLTTTKKMSKWFDEVLSPKMAKIANQRHLLAVRNGIVATIPFIIVGSLFLIILNFPLSSTPGDTLGSLMPEQINHFFLTIFRYSMGAMGLYAAFGISASLAKTYNLNSSLGGMMGVFAYLIWFDYTTLTINALGAATIFNAMISGLIAIEIYKLCVKYKITFRLPKSVPPAISDSFLTIMPILFIALIFGSLRWILGFDINNFLATALAPLQNVLTDGFGGVVLIILFVTFFWAFGIHGTSIIGTVVRPFWQIAIVENADWWAQGMVGDVPYMFPEQFLQWTVWIGGAGATIGLVIVGLIRSKSSQGKAISRVSIVPAIFNINEPAIFGYPIMLSPILMIPFLLAPLLISLASWALMVAFDVYWVAASPWTLPAPIGAFFSAGANWKSIFIPLVGTVMAVAVYWPFYRKWDHDMYKAEQEIAKTSITKKEKLKEDKILEKKEKEMNKGIKEQAKEQNPNLEETIKKEKNKEEEYHPLLHSEEEKKELVEKSQNKDKELEKQNKKNKESKHNTK